MRIQDSAFPLSGGPLLTADDVAALRKDTPGCASVVHFNNAGCGPLYLVDACQSVGQYPVDVEWCLRLSPHCCNTEEEVDTVAAGVAELAGSVRGVR